MRAAYAEPFDANGEGVGELGGLAELTLQLLDLDVAVAADEAHVGGGDLRDVDDDERLAALHRGIDGERRRLRREGHIEGARSTGRASEETEETSSRGPLRRTVSTTTRGGAPSAALRARCDGTADASRGGRRTARLPWRAVRTPRSVRSRRRSRGQESQWQLRPRRVPRSCVGAFGASTPRTPRAESGRCSTSARSFRTATADRTAHASAHRTRT